jgi:transposase
MSLPHQNPQLLHELICLKRDGWSNRQLARHFRISRNTVRELLIAHLQQREQGESVPKKPAITRESKLDPFKGEIARLLKDYPDARGTRVLEILRTLGYQGGHSIVRTYLATQRQKPVESAILRFETEPGIQGQFDWSPYSLKFRDGTECEVLCFSYILAFSRRHFIDFTLNRNFHTLVRRHVDAFHYYGGVPRQCLYDNEKTVVLRWEAGQPIYNPAFLKFITHYQCRPIACRPRTPQTKGKIERPFQYIESSLFNCRTFDDLDDLKTFARWWLANTSDLHVHDTTRRMPLELFNEKEKDALLPLPAHDYNTSEIAFLIGRDAGFVTFETNRYSIPQNLVGSLLTLRATEVLIEVFDPEMNRVTQHPRLPNGAFDKSEFDAHRGSKELRCGLDSIQAVFLTLGDHAEPFLNGLIRKFPRNPGFHARRILTFRERFHSDDIHRAIEHANRYHAFDSQAIERILIAKFQPRTLEQLRCDKASDALRAVLPTITQHPLSIYRDAFANVVPTDMTIPSQEETNENDTP